jgi:hypothetical protein
MAACAALFEAKFALFIYIFNLDVFIFKGFLGLICIWEGAD